VAKSRVIVAWKFFRGRLRGWVMRPAPAVVRWTPVVYMAGVVLLVLAGFFFLGKIEAASEPVAVQVPAGAKEKASGSTDLSAPNVLNNEVRNDAVRSGAKPPPVQVSVNNGTSPCCQDAQAKYAYKDDLKKYAEDFRWILVLILGLAGLFTLVQGIAAGFSSARFIADAEKGLDKIEKLRSDIARKYPPVLESIDRQRARALNLLRDELERASPASSADEGIDWVNNFYAGIRVSNRQLINSVERAVPYEIAGEDEPPRRYTLWLKRLARFYWSKFLYENSFGYGNLVDLERAEYLLLLGIEKTSQTFAFKNDLGTIYMEFFRDKRRWLEGQDKPFLKKETLEDFARAEQAFLESKASHGAQLRAYSNLAIMEAESRGRIFDYFPAADPLKAEMEALHKAVSYLKEAFEEASAGDVEASRTLGLIWETKRIPYYTCEAYFNLACYYARLARLETAKGAAHIDACLSALRVTAAWGLMRKEDVDVEFLERVAGGFNGNSADRPGDFFDLSRNGGEELREKLIELRPRLSGNTSANRA
jgi:hypothetical protein